MFIHQLFTPPCWCPLLPEHSSERSWHSPRDAQHSSCLSILGLLVLGRRERFAIKPPREQCPLAGWPFHEPMAEDSPRSGAGTGTANQPWFGGAGAVCDPLLDPLSPNLLLDMDRAGLGQPRESPSRVLQPLCSCSWTLFHHEQLSVSASALCVFY